MTRLTRKLRSRLDPVPAQQRPRDGLLGTVTIAVAGLALFSAVTHDIPFVGSKPGYPIRAEFAAANQVNHRTPVRVGGVEVGAVDTVTRGSTRETSLVTMRITDSRLVVRRDARADIRWRTLLGGNMYIDLEPGSPSAPPLGDIPIPVRQTTSQVELDDVTQIYDGTTADAQRTVFKELRHGLSDPAATGRTIRRLGPGLETVGRGLQPLQGVQTGDLQRLVATTSRTARGLGRDTRALGDLVASADRTLAVTEARRRPLGELIELSPHSLDSTLVTMRRLRDSLGRLDPLVAELRPGARVLAPSASSATRALAQARALLRDLRPLLRDTQPTLKALRSASSTGAPLLGELDPTVGRLNRELLPWLDRRDPSTRLRNYEAIGPWFSAVGDGAAEFNAFGNIVQFPIAPGANSVLAGSGALPRLVATCRRGVRPSLQHGCPKAARQLARILGGRR